MRKAVIAFILGFVVIVGWYFGSPQWTLGQMQSAAGANDTERLATYIDFAALRESVKSEVKAQITTKVMASNNGFDAIGGFVAMGMVDGMVDAMVNPAMMRNAFAAKTADIQQGEAPFAIKAEGAEFVRDRFDQFRLRHTGRADLVFERRGLGWMLVGIRAPVDRVAAAPDDSATPPHEYHSETQDAQAMPADPATVSPENLDLKHVAEAFADPCVGHYLNERNDPSMSAYSVDVTNRPLEVSILFSDFGGIKAIQEKATEPGKFEFTDYDDETKYFAYCSNDRIVISSKNQRFVAVKSVKQLEMSPDGE